MGDVSTDPRWQRIPRGARRVAGQAHPARRPSCGMTCDEEIVLPTSQRPGLGLPDDVLVRCQRRRGHLASEGDDGHVGSFADWVVRW